MLQLEFVVIAARICSATARICSIPARISDIYVVSTILLMPIFQLCVQDFERERSELAVSERGAILVSEESRASRDLMRVHLQLSCFQPHFQIEFVNLLYLFVTSDLVVCFFIFFF